ncbi:MAG: hypothetical protein IKS51_08625 [Erysipelotrichaceae bacterium]|nr:hypothetical protein [Erysipelotrichaceae bacterium]
MKTVISRFMIIGMTLILLWGCGSSSSNAGSAYSSSGTAPASPSVPDISDSEIIRIYDKASSYVFRNFYSATPYRDLDPDYGAGMDESFAFPAKKYKTLAEFRDHIMNDYQISESFADRLLNSVSYQLYEVDGRLYIAEADGQMDQTVGNEVSREVIRQNDTKVLLRVTYEKVDDNGSVTGSLVMDNVFVYQNGMWVVDSIPNF